MEASPPSILTSRLTSPSTGRLSPAGGGLATPLALATDAEPMRGLQRRALERARLAGLDRISVARAMTSSRRPVVLADVADNVGGGSAGDGTALLSELIRQGCRSALVIIADPEVARAAVAAAPGTYTGPLGGKTDDRRGRPVNVLAKVVAASDGRYRTSGSWMTGQTFEMGTTAVLDIDGILVVVTERRVPPFHVEQVTSLGLDPSSFDIIVAKGALAWRAAYGDVAAEIIEVDTPGVCPLDPRVLPRSCEPMCLR
jgi:microcystin degradation protein MlrC